MKYPKIPTVFKRDPATNFKTLLRDQFATPELEYLADTKWIFTEKVDGTNIRVYWDGENVAIRGRTDNAQMPVVLMDELRSIFCGEVAIEKWKRQFPEGCFCLYGEGYGAKIQKGGGNYISDGVDFVLFDVLCVSSMIWLDAGSVADIADSLDVDIVPVVGRGDLRDAVQTTEIGFNSRWGDFTAEGLVMRPEVELQTRTGDRIITKIKHKDFAAAPEPQKESPE